MYLAILLSIQIWSIVTLAVSGADGSLGATTFTLASIASTGLVLSLEENQSGPDPEATNQDGLVEITTADSKTSNDSSGSMSTPPEVPGTQKKAIRGNRETIRLKGIYFGDI